MESAPAKPNFLVRLFVAGLPLGILIMAALSFVVFFHKRNARDGSESSKYAGMMQRDINAEELTRRAKILSQDIGERSPAQQENLEAAASFVESTMGFDNMGYRVQRHEIMEDGRVVVDISADLTGTSDPESIVLVAASYAGAKDDSAAAVSALMSIAHQLTGTRHRRTLRFVAQGTPVNRAPRFPKFVSLHSEHIKEGEHVHHGVILFDGKDERSEESTLGPSSDPKSMKLTLWDVDLTDAEKGAAHVRDIAASILRLLQ